MCRPGWTARRRGTVFLAMRIAVAADEDTGVARAVLDAEILDAWFSAAASPDERDQANVAYVDEIGG